MATKFTFATVNVTGIKSAGSAIFVKGLVKQFCIDILMLHEIWLIESQQEFILGVINTQYAFMATFGVEMKFYVAASQAN